VSLNEAEENLAKNNFDLTAMIMKQNYATNKASVMKIPKNIGQIRLVSLKPGQRKFSLVPQKDCKKRNLDFHTKIDNEKVAHKNGFCFDLEQKDVKIGGKISDGTISLLAL